MSDPISHPIEPAYQDDGMIMRKVGPWGEYKHRKLGYYAGLFSTSMKNRWDCRLYMDLFAGAGKARLEDSNQVVPGSPLVALGLKEPFDEYIFCEEDEEAAAALQARVQALHSDRKSQVLNIDSNREIDKLLQAIPRFGPSCKGLTLCFVDPFNTKNLHFETLRRIASRTYVDFLVLIPSYMDIKRNRVHYLRQEDPTIDNFIGSSSWREEWDNRGKHNMDFGVFVADCFGKQMAAMGFLYEDTSDYEVVRIGEDRSLFLYHLGFFSKNKLGKKFWNETRQRTTDQMHLPL